MNNPNLQRAITEPGGITAWLRSPRLLLYFSLAATFVAYLGTADFGFVGDDRYQITGNPHLLSWHYVGRYFTQGVWSHADTRITGDYYRPLFLLWLRLNHLLFGFQPAGWHLTVLAVHLAVTALVYALARQFTRNGWGAGLAALVFGLHPAHLESVAWVSGVTDPLAALFLVGSFLYYLRGREKPGARLLGALPSWILYAASLLCKETAAVFPLLIFVCEAAHPRPFAPGGPGDAGPSPSRLRAASLAVAPYLGLTALYAAVHHLAVPDFAPVQAPLPASSLLLTLPAVLSFYFRHLLWPVGLHAVYSLPYVVKPGLVNFGIPLVFVTVLVLLLAGWFRAAERAGAVVTIAWILIPLLPVLDVRLLPHDNFLHDRYLYIPSVGLALLVALLIEQFGPSPEKIQWARPVFLIVPVLALTGLLAAGLLAARGIWKNELVFAQDAAEAAPDNPGVENNLAVVMAERGDLEGAGEIWEKTLARDPRFFSALYNLGFFSYRAGKLAAAEQYLLRALEVDRTSAPALLCLGLVQFKRGRLDDALATLRQAVALRPQGWGYHFALGYVLRARGDRLGALTEFRQELRINPQHQLAREQIVELEGRLGGNLPGGTR